MRKLVLICSLIFSFAACSDIVRVEDISDETVNILAPSNNAILNSTDVTFNWQTVEEADEYRIQIADSNFTEALQIVTDSTVTTTSFFIALNGGSYEWRVKALNSAYETAYTIQSFSILETEAVDISNESVVLLAPADAVVFNTTDTINFSWESVLNAENYIIQIATPNFDNATEIIENETVVNTSFSISNLEANSYEWRVKALNSAYETGYTTQSFTVEE